jgi:drug/metabolite transporter (DMT)-like permease
VTPLVLSLSQQPVRTHTSLAVTAVVLLAAVLHATWNALLKGGQDRLAMFVVLDGTGLAMCLLAVPFLPGPAPASWVFIGLSTVLHIGYKLLLIESYRVGGDLSQVYPLARGSAPLLVAGLASVVAGERLGPLGLAGVVVVCLGLVLLVGVSRRLLVSEGRAVGFALATGVFIAAYTVADGVGVRRSGGALGYIAWLFLAEGLPLPLYAATVGRRHLKAALRVNLPAGLAAGVLSLAAYGLVIWAQTRGALAVVAALRETSVIVAALIGSAVFGERFGYRRTVAAAVVTAGIVLLNTSR